MLSFTKTFTAFPTHNPFGGPFPPRRVPLLVALGSASTDNNGTNITTSNTSNGNNVVSGQGIGTGIDDASPPAQARPRITPPDTVEIRFKRGSRKRRKQEEQGLADKMQSKKASPPKDWDSMTLTEKLVELYVGEKGMLFWLNKFAYASIFIVIGGWILFRFVGPALNLYQLDTPPLAPTSMFK